MYDGAKSSDEHDSTFDDISNNDGHVGSQTKSMTFHAKEQDSLLLTTPSSDRNVNYSPRGVAAGGPCSCRDGRPKGSESPRWGMKMGGSSVGGSRHSPESTGRWGMIVGGGSVVGSSQGGIQELESFSSGSGLVAVSAGTGAGVDTGSVVSAVAAATGGHEEGDVDDDVDVEALNLEHTNKLSSTTTTTTTTNATTQVQNVRPRRDSIVVNKLRQQKQDTASATTVDSQKLSNADVSFAVALDSRDVPASSNAVDASKRVTLSSRDIVVDEAASGGSQSKHVTASVYDEELLNQQTPISAHAHQPKNARPQPCDLQRQYEPVLGQLRNSLQLSDQCVARQSNDNRKSATTATVVDINAPATDFSEPSQTASYGFAPQRDLDLECGRHIKSMTSPGIESVAPPRHDGKVTLEDIARHDGKWGDDVPLVKVIQTKTTVTKERRSAGRLLPGGRTVESTESWRLVTDGDKGLSTPPYTGAAVSDSSQCHEAARHQSSSGVELVKTGQNTWKVVDPKQLTRLLCTHAHSAIAADHLPAAAAASAASTVTSASRRCHCCHNRSSASPQNLRKSSHAQEFSPAHKASHARETSRAVEPGRTNQSPSYQSRVSRCQQKRRSRSLRRSSKGASSEVDSEGEAVSGRDSRAGSCCSEASARNKQDSSADGVKCRQRRRSQSRSPSHRPTCGSSRDRSKQVPSESKRKLSTDDTGKKENRQPCQHRPSADLLSEAETGVTVDVTRLTDTRQHIASTCHQHAPSKSCDCPGTTSRRDYSVNGSKQCTDSTELKHSPERTKNRNKNKTKTEGVSMNNVDQCINALKLVRCNCRWLTETETRQSSNRNGDAKPSRDVTRQGNECSNAASLATKHEELRPGERRRSCDPGFQTTAAEDSRCVGTADRQGKSSTESGAGAAGGEHSAWLPHVAVETLTFDDVTGRPDEMPATVASTQQQRQQQQQQQQQQPMMRRQTDSQQRQRQEPVHRLPNSVYIYSPASTLGTSTGTNPGNIVGAVGIDSDVRLPPELQNKRLLGELAAQLDRRILTYVFQPRLLGTGRRRTRTFYGYSSENIESLIEQESLIDEKSCLIDEVRRYQLYYRYKYLIHSLQPFGYNISFYPHFTNQLVNRYGQLSGRKTVCSGLQPVGVEWYGELCRLIELLALPNDRQHCIVLLNCLQLLATDDALPLFYWH